MSELMMVQENDFFDDQDLPIDLFCDEEEFDSWRMEDIGEMDNLDTLFD